MSVDLDSMKKLWPSRANIRQPKIHLALGVHPGMVNLEPAQMAFDFMRANMSEACAIGETGLDYWYKWVRKDETERQKQKDFFAMHLDCWPGI